MMSVKDLVLECHQEKFAIRYRMNQEGLKKNTKSVIDAYTNLYSPHVKAQLLEYPVSHLAHSYAFMRLYPHLVGSLNQYMCQCITWYQFLELSRPPYNIRIDLRKITSNLDVLPHFVPHLQALVNMGARKTKFVTQFLNWIDSYYDWSEFDLRDYNGNAINVLIYGDFYQYFPIHPLTTHIKYLERFMEPTALIERLDRSTVGVCIQSAERNIYDSRSIQAYLKYRKSNYTPPVKPLLRLSFSFLSRFNYDPYEDTNREFLQKLLNLIARKLKEQI